MSFVQVAIAVPLRQLFTYKVPEGMNISLGSRVFVPFGRRTVAGYVMEINDSSMRTGVMASVRKDAITPVRQDDISIKDIIESPDIEPVFAPKMVELVKWVSDYYCAPIGEVCKTALPANLTKYARKRKKEAVLKETAIDEAFLSAPDVILTSSQKKTYEELRFHVQRSMFQTTLLHGITGSGKTEVYLRLFADVIKSGSQAVFLVPEIGMTPQTVGRIIARFGENVGIYHSQLTNAKRLYEWKRIQDGGVKIVIGTRSAIFAPFKNLGLIVLDEEHDPSYKQDENPRYNGRDTAVMRAKIENIPCILGSATPSIESFTNFKNKKYNYIHLPERPSGVKLPSVEIVDMREVPKGASLSPQLINAISETLQKKEQAILFLNRRGFASFVICVGCGETFLCPNCSVTLTYHRNDGILICHYCEYKIQLPKVCSKCKTGKIQAFGSGTERIETEVKSFFPSAKIARLDMDSARKTGERPKILSHMKSGGTDILIGTQMITKGHDFPNVSFVGIISADMSLNFPDFRAPERTFQLITQVAGRSGRRDLQGKVIIQTFTPEHYAIEAARKHDFFEFYNEELPHRRELLYPPFGRLALIRVQGMKDELVEKTAHEIFGKLSVFNNPPPPPFSKGGSGGIMLLGPAPAPMAKVRNKSRWHILIKSNDINKLRHVLSAVISYEKAVPRGVKVMVDVDPINML